MHIWDSKENIYGLHVRRRHFDLLKDDEKEELCYPFIDFKLTEENDAFYPSHHLYESE